jgi:two-component system, sporulation sensor kinase D
VSLILWNTYIFFQKFKEEERTKMEILATAYKKMFSNADLDADVSFEIQIISSNYNIPLILTDEQGNILEFQNLDEKKVDDLNYLKQQLSIMKTQNEALQINLDDTSKQYLYYRDSEILTNLKYYPLGLVLILFLFSVVIYLFNHSSKIAAQNQLWTGMAKETAHQIGTPLTSLLGWIALLREDAKNMEVASEIEKDVLRLEVIANRFSKIGSETPLSKQDVVALTENAFQYLQSRASKQVQFKFKSEASHYIVNTHAELYGWVIENLVKNAIDAMQGRGKIYLKMYEDSQYVMIRFTDTGKGIPKKLFKKIFEPGFTTKKRGWGLGLSLSKRIIEDFHNGKIMVLESEVGKGTVFLIKLPKK